MQSKKWSDLKVAIIGGGIGGAATAVALQHEGIRAEVYEQAPAIKEVGAGIGMRPSSVELFQEWGIYDEIASKSGQSDFMEILSGDGDVSIKKKWPVLTENTADKWARLIHRADLLHTLIAQLPAESIHLGHQCESVIRHENRAKLYFTNGNAVDVDLVIAADGIRSITRKKLFCDIAPVFSGTHAYRGIVSEEKAFDLVADHTLRIFVDGSVRVYLLPLQSRHQVSLDITVSSTDASWRPQIEKNDILKHLINFDIRIQKIAAAVDDYTCRALYDIEPITHWCSNCIVLLGDAAHAMLHNQGQGANMAIQDAGALVKALRQANTISEALEIYESQRKPITDKYQLLSRQFPSPHAKTAFSEKTAFETP